MSDHMEQQDTPSTHEQNIVYALRMIDISICSVLLLLALYNSYNFWIREKRKHNRAPLILLYVILTIILVCHIVDFAVDVEYKFKQQVLSQDQQRTLIAAFLASILTMSAGVCIVLILIELSMKMLIAKQETISATERQSIIDSQSQIQRYKTLLKVFQVIGYLTILGQIAVLSMWRYWSNRSLSEIKIRLSISYFVQAFIMLLISVIFYRIATQAGVSKLLKKEIQIVILITNTWSICFVLEGFSLIYFKVDSANRFFQLKRQLCSVYFTEFIPLGLIIIIHFCKFRNRIKKEKLCKQQEQQQINQSLVNDAENGCLISSPQSMLSDNSELNQSYMSKNSALTTKQSKRLEEEDLMRQSLKEMEVESNDDSLSDIDQQSLMSSTKINEEFAYQDIEQPQIIVS